MDDGTAPVRHLGPEEAFERGPVDAQRSVGHAERAFVRLAHVDQASARPKALESLLGSEVSDRGGAVVHCAIIRRSFQ